MNIDCHVHISAFSPGHGLMSARLLNSPSFRFMRWKFGMRGTDEATERALESLLAKLLEQTPELDAAVVLAFDAVYTREGFIDSENTHLFVTNDYVIELASRHRKFLFGASVHPYRKDAISEIERCVKNGAVLMKWLPIVQNIDPSDPICILFYEALAHYNLPLLSHTGSEHALPNLNRNVADPMLLKPALDRGVKVIMAHCGSRLLPWETDFLPTFSRLAKEYEHCYGDTAAMNVPNRWYALDAVLNDPVLNKKVVHGSDWPILSVPPPHRIGWGESCELLAEPNAIRRDVLIKEKIGFGQDYLQRATTVLRLPK